MLPERFTNPNYGKGTHTIGPDDAPDIEQEEEHVKQWLATFLAKPTVELPRLPTVATEILELSRKPNTRIEDIASVLEREPILAGRVLKLANSAFYGVPGRVGSVRDAVLLLGRRPLVSVLTVVSTMRSSALPV